MGKSSQQKAKCREKSSLCCTVLNFSTKPLTVIIVFGIYLFLAYGMYQYHMTSGREFQKRYVPTLYEFYTANGIKEGLKAPNTGFTLNGFPITIYSGSVHYFRIHPAYWRDRLRKARAAGLNAIDTYVPWNLHEPLKGEFDFGNGQNDLSILLNVRRFIQIAKEEDLFVILRPGPYICAEWEYGGLPSWLLRYKGIRVRTSDPIFIHHVRLYFDQLLPHLSTLTFTQGGPIIALQIENEYGSFGTSNSTRDIVYLATLRDMYLKYNLNELYFTSDAPAATKSLGALPNVLQTANFATRPRDHFSVLLKNQPDKALMAMEFWSGWFDHWMQPKHMTGHPSFVFATVLTSIFAYNASVNFYMFAGGTTYAFMSGANIDKKYPIYHPDVSSYDYGAPLSEAGDYTTKYAIAKTLIAANNPILTRLPQQPPQTVKTAYPPVEVSEYIPILDLFDQVLEEDRVKISAINVNSSMEHLSVNRENGQSYGITVYRKKIRANSNKAIIKIIGHVRDIAMLLLNGKQITSAPTGYESLKHFGFWPARNAELMLTGLQAGQYYQLDILVENLGRINFGLPPVFRQKKGLYEGPIFWDHKEITDWEVLALQLKSSWVQRLVGWRRIHIRDPACPAIFRTRFILDSFPNDTFLDMGSWGKGCIYVNGFPLGRYFNLGPQKTNFIPAPLLKRGENEIIIFEHYTAATSIKFSDVPKLGPTVQ